MLCREVGGWGSTARSGFGEAFTNHPLEWCSLRHVEWQSQVDMRRDVTVVPNLEKKH